MAARKNPAAVALGRKGGQATSARKIAAARRNARKGGRPAKFLPGDRVIGVVASPTALRNQAGEVLGRAARAQFSVRFDHLDEPQTVRSWWIQKEGSEDNVDG